MADNTFPDALRDAQTRLHQALAELAALCRSLPWSVEPLPGWAGEEHSHTGVVTGGRDASPGWTVEQEAAVSRLRQECVDLSIAVTTHPYWETVDQGDMVKERQRLKAVTKPVPAPVDVAQAA